ncbi:PE-PPE domain-containing protein [Mycolicibacterium sp. CBMA 234]|uniref:PE-PPE domain-containing protein n=1 Tax=Mycolicibacterium sp. CBMA 234 TaxID=1918495 RepID=UPI001391B939|nr:PE-PPE domain-containing protein [Mycolicibacterium sp. CBMA 234]
MEWPSAVAISAVAGVALLGGTEILTPGMALAAPTALVVGGTGMPDPTQVPAYIPNLERLYFPFTVCQNAPCDVVPVIYPAQLFPLAGKMTLDDSVAQGSVSLTAAFQHAIEANPTGDIVITGSSQGAMVAALLKAKLAADPSAPPAGQVQFVLSDNEYRPNGGLLARFPGLSVPGLGITGGDPTRSDTGYSTLDVAMQYDGFADFPAYPINLLATANAFMGILYIHGTDLTGVPMAQRLGIPTTRTGPDGYTEDQFQSMLNDSANRQTYGDTTYITIPTSNLPLLQPLRDLGAFTGTSFAITPVVDLIQPVLRVLIETGYNREAPYGQPTPAGLFPPINPVKLARDLAAATGQGISQALNDVIHGGPRSSTDPAKTPAVAAAVPVPRVKSTTSAANPAVRDKGPKTAAQTGSGVPTADVGVAEPKKPTRTPRTTSRVEKSLPSKAAAETHSELRATPGRLSMGHSKAAAPQSASGR